MRFGDLRAIQVGGRGRWRVERPELEAYIEGCYAGVEQLFALTVGADRPQTDRPYEEKHFF